jgi:hypothetical protein
VGASQTACSTLLPGTTAASASSNGFFSSASDSGHAGLSLTAPNINKTQILTGRLGNTASGNTTFAGNATTSGTSQLGGSFDLVGNHKYAFSATGTASATVGGFNSRSASASLDIPGVDVNGTSANADFFSPVSSGSFSDSSSGILGNGVHSFFASVSGISNENGSFSGDSATLDFTLQLTPIPEPGTFALLGPELLLVGLGFLGAAGIGWWRRCKALAAA